MADHRTKACLNLWVSVVNAALKEHRDLITRARRAEKSAASNRFTANGKRYRAGSLEAEIDRARRYFESADFREVCSRAGFVADAEKALAWCMSEKGCDE